MLKTLIRLGFWIISMALIIAVMFSPIYVTYDRDNDWLMLLTLFTIPCGIALLVMAFAVYTLVIEEI